MLTTDAQDKLKAMLLRHESYQKYPYLDSLGKITIGIGYNLTDRGMTDEWINGQYETDVCYFYQKLSQFPWYRNLNYVRQIVLIDMAFMGFKKLLSFEKMLIALERGDYKTAALEMLNSQWAQQVKSRAVELAKLMESGIYE